MFTGGFASRRTRKVKRLDRQWVPIHLAAQAAEFGEKVEEFEERLVDTRKDAGLM